MNSLKKTLFAVVVAAGLAASAGVSAAARQAPADVLSPGFAAPAAVGIGTVQRGGMTLSQAVESIRRRGNVERVISAETRVSNGQEIHVIKVLTKDGKVRTHRVPGRRVDRG